jgi:hypothetical protein
MTSSEIADLFREYSEPDEYEMSYQLNLLRWGEIQRVGHGYDAYVNYGCRCSVCRAANRDYMRGYLARRYGHVTKRAYRCGSCGGAGHSARTCDAEMARVA